MKRIDVGELVGIVDNDGHRVGLLHESEIFAEPAAVFGFSGDVQEGVRRMSFFVRHFAPISTRSARNVEAEIDIDVNTYVLTNIFDYRTMSPWARPSNFKSA